MVSIEREIEAVCAVAERLGLRRFSPVVLGGYSNTLIRLAPYPVVARVAKATGVIRDLSDLMAREIAFAEALAQRGAPSVRVSSLLPPGPHSELGFHLSFWDFIEVEIERPSPAQAGAMLRQLHVTLDDVTAVNLRPLAPFYTAAEIAAGPLAERLGAESKRLVRNTFERLQQDLAAISTPFRPLHGDAHHGNLWVTPNGMVWGDLEDACAGPIEWDLACLTASSVVLGTRCAATEALTSYDRPYNSSHLDLLIIARTLQAIAWALVALENIDGNPRLLARLAWIRARA